MGIFDDKQYDEMDWISKAIEPTLSPLNDMLSKIPDETSFTPQQVLRASTSGYRVGAELQHFLLQVCQQSGLKLSTWDDDFKKLIECFNLTLDKPIIVNFENNTAEGGTLKLIKTKKMFEEKELEQMLGRKGIELFLRMNLDKIELARANEIGELLGNITILQKRSVRQKVNEIISTMRLQFQENKWNIKNIELADKVCLWITVYLQEGNLAALTNFCKFKVMTHSGNPIYSMEEEAL